jgi:hypothetical protein
VDKEWWWIKKEWGWWIKKEVGVTGVVDKEIQPILL